MRPRRARRVCGRKREDGSRAFSVYMFNIPLLLPSDPQIISN